MEVRRLDVAELRLAQNKKEHMPGKEARRFRMMRQKTHVELETALWDLETEIITHEETIREEEENKSGFKAFFSDLTDLDRKPRKDLYLVTVIVQFIIFITVAAGFSAFQSNSATAERLSENSIPVAFLLGLLSVFAVIVLDRAFYLMRAMTAKLVLHYVLLFLVHLFFFIVLPLNNDRSFPGNGLLVFIYILMLIYFLLSAEQLRTGYPHFVLGNALARNAQVIGYIFYSVYRLIPFLHEVRVSASRHWCLFFLPRLFFFLFYFFLLPSSLV